MKVPNTDKEALMVLNAIGEVGPITFKKLMGYFKNEPLAIFKATKRELMSIHGVGNAIADSILGWDSNFDLTKEQTNLSRMGGSFVSLLDRDYPALLKEISDSPIGLYVLGSSQLELRSIAIIGSRRATLYGIGVAKQFGRELAKLGFCVVSGMARGIDSAAHEGALQVGGKTAAILGCGVDIVYPPENKHLYDRIQESGVVYSEYRLGRSADKRTFPVRNRIISGCAQAVVVIETDSNGGSMITARFAADQGRHVFAVPGRIDQASSRGCHDLIREGASLCGSVDVILEELSYLNKDQLEFGFNKSKNVMLMPDISALHPKEGILLKYLWESGPKGLDELMHATQMNVAEVNSHLMLLELSKRLKKRLDGKFEAMPCAF